MRKRYALEAFGPDFESVGYATDQKGGLTQDADKALMYDELDNAIAVKRILQPVYAPDWLTIVDVKNDLVRVQ